MPAKIIWVSAAALIDGKGRVLLAQRPEGKKMAGLWEFPGGKIEAGETPELALIRELKEELGIYILSSSLKPITFSSHNYGDFHLLMPLYACLAWTGEVTPKENQAITWAYPREFNQYPMPPADIPLIPNIRRFIEHEYSCC